VLEASIAVPDFHARFSAVARHYEYRVLCRRAPPALDRGHIWHVGRALDVETMARAARALLGTHDFTTFRAAECQAKSPVKTLDRLDVAKAGRRDRVLCRGAFVSAPSGALHGRNA